MKNENISHISHTFLVNYWHRKRRHKINMSVCLSIYPVLQQLSPSSGNQTPFLSVSPLIWS